MVIQTFTLDQFKVYLNNLPKKMQNSSESINDEMAKSLQRRMELRLNPSSAFSTGNLKENIKVEKVTNKKTQIVGPYYWIYVNLGIGPEVAFPTEFLDQHIATPSEPGKWVDQPRGWVNTNSNPLKFDGNKGFVDNAIISFDKDAVNVINKAMEKVFIK